MDSISEKYADFFSINEELRALIERFFEHHPPPQDLCEGYVLFAIGKAYKTHAAILLLCREGYGEDAAILSRSLFELSITAKYISDDSTGARAKKFVDFDWVIRARRYEYSLTNAEMTKEFEKRIAADPQTSEKIATILREAKKVKEGYTEQELRKGWAGKSIKEIADAAGRTDIYKTVYSLQCDLSHSAVSVSNDYLREAGETLSMEIAPSDNWIERALVISIQHLVDLIEVWSAIFAFDVEESLKGITQRYAEAVKATKRG